MPRQARSLEDYRTDITTRSSEERKESVQRHTEYLRSINTSSAQSKMMEELLRVQKLFNAQNSKGFEAIMNTVHILDRAMDGVMTQESEQALKAGMLDTYATLLMQCDEYLASHSGHRFTAAGKHRVEAVRRLRALADDEAQLLQSALSEIESFGSGITMRQLFAGMRPLKELVPVESDFALPKAVEFGPEQKPDVVDPIRELNRMRASLQEDEQVPQNTRAVLDILLEQITRARLDGQKSLGADLVDRVVELCRPGGKDSTLARLAQAASAYKNSLQLTSTAQAMEGKTELRDDEKFDWDDQNQLVYPEYRVMSPQVARYLAAHTSVNQEGSEAQRQLYGKGNKGRVSAEGRANGYILTSNSFEINKYLREFHDRSGFDENRIHRNFKVLSTIGMLDRASRGNHLPEKTRVYRLLKTPYLKYVFGLESPSDTTLNPDTAQQINKQAGKIVTDSNFMCSGFVADKIFITSPIVLTLLCDEGTPVFTTSNLAEGEIIFGRNTSYMILGAVMHSGAGALRLPTSHKDTDDQYAEDKERIAEFRGLEIFAKVLDTEKKEAKEQQTQYPVNKAQSEDAFEAFKAKQVSYFGLNGKHGDNVHRNAYLQMARADQASLDEQEAAAMDEYTNDSGAINRRLRSGELRHDVTDAQNVFMKRAFAKHPIPVEMTVYRGVSDGFLSFLMNSNPDLFEQEERDLVIRENGSLDHRGMLGMNLYSRFRNVVFQDAAFVSTSTNKYFARRWANMVRHNERAAKYQGKTDDASKEKLKKHTGQNVFQDIKGAHVLNIHLPVGTRAMFVDTMFTRTGRARGQDEVTLDAGYSYQITGVRLVGPGMLEMDVECLG